MKLLNFSPWQQTATSIPSSTDIDDIKHNFVDSSSSPSTGSLSKRKKLLSNEISSFDMQPDLAITSSHQINILGHQTSRKILRSSNANNHSDDKSIVKQVPHWIYTSRPGPTSSFFPNESSEKTTKSNRLGATVEHNSRTVFVLQNDNLVLKIWGLDDNVNGPDDESNGEPCSIQKVKFDSPVLFMETIPMKRQVRVKIKGSNSTDTIDDKVQGGIAGLLSNGQMFVVLVCLGSNSRTIKVGVFGENKDQNVRKTRGTPSKTANRRNQPQLFDMHLYSDVGFSAIVKDSSNNDVGQKRKFEKVESQDDKDEWGEITLTTVSIDPNPKKSDSICFHKQSISISSYIQSQEKNVAAEHDASEHETIKGSYSVKVGYIKLPHNISKAKSNGNGAASKHKKPFVTQLDSSHISLVYRDSSSDWFATILDTRYGELVVKPFLLKNVQAANKEVSQIGGLSTSILAVLTSDNILTVYDVRRAVLLHETDISVSLTSENESSNFLYGIATHWSSGTIGIICNEVTPSKNGSKKTISISCARVGVYDNSTIPQMADVGKKPFLKGSYNLARIVSSSLATTAKSYAVAVESNLNVLNMTDWYESNDKDKSITSVKSTEEIIQELEKYLPASEKKNGLKKGLSFYDSFEEARNALNTTNSTPCHKKLKNRIHPKSSSVGNLPQKFIDVSTTIALEIILFRDCQLSDMQNATRVLLKCIKTGMVSGRNHFDKVILSNRKSNVDVFRLLLFKLQSRQNTKEDTTTCPLTFISHFLQHCKDGLPEHMLVTMLHFSLCHPTDEQLASQWNNSNNDGWYVDAAVKVLEKRLEKATGDIETSTGAGTERCEDLQKLVQNLKDRLAVSRRLFFIGKIVTDSNCNPALLRSALKNGLSQISLGEVEVLMQSLGKLLERSSKEGRRRKDRDSFNSNKSSRIIQWISAVVDSNLGVLLTASDSSAIEQVKREVSGCLSQTQAILSLDELFNQVDAMINNKKEKNKKVMEVASIPLYGIESLSF